MSQGSDVTVYSLMQTGQPYRSYIKTILGKLHIMVIDPFSNKPVGLMINGNPRGNSKDDCIVDVWSEMEDVYLRRANKRHFETGRLINYERKPSDEPEKSPNELSDEELEKIINSRFLSLQSSVNKLTSEAPIYRLIQIARDLEKSEKIISFLEGKLSELQLKDYQPTEG